MFDSDKNRKTKVIIPEITTHHCSKCYLGFNCELMRKLHEEDCLKRKKNRSKMLRHMEPFGIPSTDCLTGPDKANILTSNEPIALILDLTHFDSNKKMYQNLLYDNNEKTGLIFNGIRIRAVDTDTFLKIIYESKRMDILRIYDQIQSYCSEGANITIGKLITDLFNADRYKFGIECLRIKMYDS